MNGAGSNALTLGAVDPLSGQHELKHAAVAVERLSYPWRMVVLRRGDGVALLQRAQPLLQRFGYASCGLYGRERPVLVLRVADARPAPAEWIAELDRMLDWTTMPAP